MFLLYFDYFSRVKVNHYYILLFVPVFNTLYGKKITLPKEKAIFRPSAYAIIIQDGTILLIKTKRTGKYFFPGGAVELTETVNAAVQREVREEIGIEVSVHDLMHFEENLFYYDPTDDAWHCLLLFFECSTNQSLPSHHDQIDEDEAVDPQWVPISDLTENDFQDAGRNVFQKIKNRI